MKYKRMCTLLAAYNLYSAGVSVVEIARQANKHPSTTHRWFKNF
jgi:hypothetical protein